MRNEAGRWTEKRGGKMDGQSKGIYIYMDENADA